jgi:hypothetical protein
MGPATKWLDRYSGQSTEELIALEGLFRTDSIVLAFEQALDQKAQRRGDGALSEQERIILAVEALEREVNNGGYAQFFANSSKEYAAVIVDALNRIGCPPVAELTGAAIDALGIAGALTVDAIDRAMSSGHGERTGKLSRCDEQYFRLSADLAQPLLEFIKSNRTEIVLG